MRKMFLVILISLFGLPGLFSNVCQAEPGTIEQYSMWAVQESSGQDTLNVYKISGVAPWNQTTRVVGPNNFDEWHWDWWGNLVSYNYKEGMYYEAYRWDNNSPDDGNYTLQLYQDTSQPPADTNTLTGFSQNDLAVVEISTATPVDYSYLNSTTPTFSWTGITDETATPYYRIRIEDPNESIVAYISDRSLSTIVTVPAGFLDPDRSYEWRVETFDASDSSAMNVSWSDWGTFFTGSDNPEVTPLTVDFAFMRSRLRTNNRQYIEMAIGITGPSPEDVEIQVEGPLAGTPDTYDLDWADYYGNSYFLQFNEQLPDGTYRFTVTDNRAGGESVTVNRTLQENWIVDLIYEDGTNIEDDIYLDTDRPTITWQPVGSPQYRLSIFSVDWENLYSVRTSQTLATVPSGILMKNTAYNLRVETFDETDDPLTSGPDNGNRGTGDNIRLFIANDNEPANFSGTINSGTSGAGGPIYILIQDNPVLNVGEEYGFTMIADPAVDGWDYTLYNVPRQTDLYIYVIYDHDGSRSYTVGDYLGTYSSTPVNFPLTGGVLTGYDITLTTEVLGTTVAGTVSCENYTTGTVYVGAFRHSNDDQPVEEVALTGGPGPYTIPDLPVGGRFYLKAYWDSDGSGSGGTTLLDQTGEHQFNPIIVGASGNSGIDIDIETTGFIAGRVYESDGVTPIANLHVYVDDEATGNWIDGTYTDDKGFYSMPLPDGMYNVNACPGCDDRPYANQAVNSIEVIDPTVTTQDFSLISGGTISGTVYESDGTTPIANLWIEVFDWSSGYYLEDTRTDNDGNYTLRVNPGSYKVGTCANCDDHPYVDEYYDNTTQNNATEVVVTNGNDTPEINFTLSSGGTISGTVYESDGTTPIANLWIVVNGWNSGNYIGGTSTDSDGNYTFNAAPGSYRVNTCASCNSYPYVDEFYDNGNWDSASEVVVTDGNDTPDIDFILSIGGTISGTVYDAATTTAITGVSNLYISALSGDPCGNNEHWGRGEVNPVTGEYTIEGLPAGDLYIYTDAGCNFYKYQMYDEDPGTTGSCENYDPIVLTEGQQIDGKDFYLEKGGMISGTVTETDGTTPLSNLHVMAFVGSDGSFSQGGNTDDNGHYCLIVDAPATPDQNQYKVQACPSCSGPMSYIDEYYQDKYIWENGDLVNVTLDLETQGIDFSLNRIIAGDIDGDEDVDLVDLIKGLQVMTGDTPAGNYFSTGDTNGDYRIGMEDLLFIIGQM